MHTIIDFLVLKINTASPQILNKTQMVKTSILIRSENNKNMVTERYVSGFVRSIAIAIFPGGKIIQRSIMINASPTNKSSISNLVTAPSMMPFKAIKPRKKQTMA